MLEQSISRALTSEERLLLERGELPSFVSNYQALAIWIWIQKGSYAIQPPLFFDATSSGLQIISILTGNKELAEMTN
jgi:hypothetical protein